MNHNGCKPFSYQNQDIKTKRRRDTQTLGIRKYQDKLRSPYLHLVDGGASDNLGVRGFLQIAAAQHNDFLRMTKAYGLTGVKKVLLLLSIQQMTSRRASHKARVSSVCKTP